MFPTFAFDVTPGVDYPPTIGTLMHGEARRLSLPTGESLPTPPCECLCQGASVSGDVVDEAIERAREALGYTGNPDDSAVAWAVLREVRALSGGDSRFSREFDALEVRARALLSAIAHEDDRDRAAAMRDELECVVLERADAILRAVEDRPAVAVIVELALDHVVEGVVAMAEGLSMSPWPLKIEFGR